MSDELDVRLAEIEAKNTQIALEIAREKTATARADASARKSDGWIKFVFGGLIGAIAAYGTAYLEYTGRIREAQFDFDNRDREIDLELARLSLSILSGEYDEDDVDNSLPARMFALRALSTGTGILIPSEDMDTWARTGITPTPEKDLWGVASNPPPASLDQLAKIYPWADPCNDSSPIGRPLILPFGKGSEKSPKE